MLLSAVLAFFQNPLHLSLLIVSWAMALISFLYWREHPKASYLYAHLFFLFLPLLDFAVAVPCQVPFVQGLLSFCSLVITRTVIFLIPVAFMLALLFGVVAGPALYRRLYRARRLGGRRYGVLSSKAGLSGVAFWALDTGRPLAFSFGRNVLMSVGMFELLNKKEQDAVLLHELGHVRQKSSASKVSLALARLFSPVAHFASVGRRVDLEERAADRFAVTSQGTVKYLRAAKLKLAAYCSERR